MAGQFPKSDAGKRETVQRLNLKTLKRSQLLSALASHHLTSQQLAPMPRVCPESITDSIELLQTLGRRKRALLPASHHLTSQLLDRYPYYHCLPIEVLQKPDLQQIQILQQ